MKETKIGVQDSGKSEEKKAEQGPPVYENKLVIQTNTFFFFFFFSSLIVSLFLFSNFLFSQEAKNAFKALLESANVGSDWTWDQVNSVFYIMCSGPIKEVIYLKGELVRP